MSELENRFCHLSLNPNILNIVRIYHLYPTPRLEARCLQGAYMDPADYWSLVFVHRGIVPENLFFEELELTITGR